MRTGRLGQFMSALTVGAALLGAPKPLSAERGDGFPIAEQPISEDKFNEPKVDIKGLLTADYLRTHFSSDLLKARAEYTRSIAQNRLEMIALRDLLIDLKRDENFNRVHTNRNKITACDIELYNRQPGKKLGGENNELAIKIFTQRYPRGLNCFEELDEEIRVAKYVAGSLSESSIE